MVQIGVATRVSAANRPVDVNQPSVSDAEQTNTNAGHSQVVRSTVEETDRFFQPFG